MKIKGCNLTLLYMCSVTEIYIYIDESRTEVFFNRIMYVLPRKNCGTKES